MYRHKAHCCCQNGWVQAADSAVIQPSRSHHVKHRHLCHALSLCMAVALLLGTICIAKPVHSLLAASAPSHTLLLTGSIASCSMPHGAAAQFWAGAHAVLDVDCSYSLLRGGGGSSSSSSRNGALMASERETGNAMIGVPSSIEVFGLDALTCAVFRATTDTSPADGAPHMPQQQYVYLLQHKVDSQKHTADSVYQVVEYALLQGTHTEETLAFLLAEWGSSSSIKPLGCHKSMLSGNGSNYVGRSSSSSSSSSSTWQPSSAQQRHLLQDTSPNPTVDGSIGQAAESWSGDSPSASSPPGTPLPSLEPIDVGNTANSSLEDSGIAVSSLDPSSNQSQPVSPVPDVASEAEGKSAGGQESEPDVAKLSPSPKVKGGGSKGPDKGSEVADNTSKARFNSTNTNSNSTAGWTSVNTSNSDASSKQDNSPDSSPVVEAAAGPADVQQQQALTAILADSRNLTGTANNTAAVDRKVVCALPALTGPCRASIPQWAYDVQQGTCTEFTWGGCQGNGNRFETMQDCLSACAGVVGHNTSVSGGYTAGTTSEASTASGGPAPPVPATPVPATEVRVAAPPAPAPVPSQPLATTILPDQVVGDAPATAASAGENLPTVRLMQLAVVVVVLMLQALAIE